MAGLAFVVVGAGKVQAASDPSSPAPDLAVLEQDRQQSNSTRVADVEVNGDTTPTTIPTLPAAVEDTPQTINVISARLLQQQNSTTLAEALRNVPGITLAIGEGGVVNGDQFRIRGLDAKDDLYVDGLRDFGLYVRDSFNYEQIEVLKGPSGASVGRGTTGGAINTTSKTPRLRDFTEATAGVGTADYQRPTLDWNRQINETTALRVNLMGTRTDIADRDRVENDRWGIAPSIGFGLGTDTTFTASYLHQEGSGRPDFGVPVIAPDANTVATPVTEQGVDRDTFYGYDSDTDDSNVDIVTLQFQHRFSDQVSIRSATRLGRYERDFGASAPSCRTTVPTGAPDGTLPCITAFYDNDPNTIPFAQIGSLVGFEQRTTGIQNITTALITTPVAGNRNELVVGFDLSAEENQRDVFGFTGTPGIDNRPPQNLFDPNNDFRNVRTDSPLSSRDSEGRDYAIFASNQFWLNDQWSIVGGLRIQRFEAEFTQTTFPTDTDPTTTVIERSSESDLVNPKASLIWQPDEDTTLYASWARSATPVGSSIATTGSTIGNDAIAALDPEENETFEAGIKATLFGGLLVQGSVFQVEKNNVVETDGAGTVTTTGDAQRVRGVELALSGQITDQWALYGNYTYLDSETTDSTTVTAIGNRSAFVPENSAAIWSTYAIGGLTVGGGVNYTGEMFLNNDELSSAPSQVSLDGLLSYEFDRYRIALNAYNLTDELNYSQVQRGRVVPSPGRTAVLTFSARF